MNEIRASWQCEKRRSRGVRFQSKGSVAGTVALGLLGASSAWGQCQYEFIAAPDPHPSAFIGFFPTSIGEDGVVGGFITTEPDIPAYWEPGVGLFVLPRPSGSTERVAVWDVLNRDAMVGSLSDGVPLFWRDGQMEILPTPARAPGAIAHGINRHLQIVGDAAGTTLDGLSTNDIPVLWDNGQFIELPMPEGAIGARATHINDHGLIAGWARFAGGTTDTKVVIWRDMQPNVVGAIAGGFNIHPNGLTSSGVLIGSDVTGPAGSRAFLWRDGAFTLLPGPLGTFSSSARGISNAGQIVGWASTPDLGRRGHLWQNGSSADLTSLTINGIVIREAIGINDDGIIAVSTGVLVPRGAAPGDIDKNCRVNVTDLLLLLGQWGQEASFADVNKDGSVNHWDLIELLSNWG